MHGFTHETATGQQPGVVYHAQSDARSSVAILDFFAEVFGGSTRLNAVSRQGLDVDRSV
jgi:hypothetical protein